MRIKERARCAAWFVLVASLLAMFGCSGIKSSGTGSTPNGKNASITADPNPIPVCDGSGVGVTRLSWTSVGPSKVEVHVGSPDGVLFAQTAPTATSQTGKWVTNEMIFYLQDTSGGKPLTAANTLATATVKITADGCR